MSGGARMLVAEVGRFGGPEVLTARRAPDPAAAPGQVVIGTAAADVLLVDTMIPVRAWRGFLPDPAAVTCRATASPGGRVIGAAGRLRPVIGQTFPPRWPRPCC